MRSIAFFVFPRLTLLDLVGPYDALRRVRTMGVDPALRWQHVGTRAPVLDDSGTRVHVDVVLPPLDDFELLVIPGGFGVDDLRHDATALDYLRTWGQARPVASVCSGSLLLGDLGWLAGRRATTHWQRHDALRPLCGEVVIDERVVDAGRIITAGGVTSGIDLGLHLVGRFWGAEAQARIARQMDWPGIARGP